MSEMVERGARAAYEAYRSKYAIVDMPSWEETPYDKSAFLDYSRAVIEAMRDAPDQNSTPAVLIAGKKSLYSCSSDPELEDARGCWHAMIDEALK